MSKGVKVFRSATLAAAFLLLAGVSASGSAGAHGWQSHHHDRHGSRHRHLRIHSYAPRHHVSVPVRGWGWGCGYRSFVTRFGALAYREVCH